MYRNIIKFLCWRGLVSCLLLFSGCKDRETLDLLNSSPGQMLQLKIDEYKKLQESAGGDVRALLDLGILYQANEMVGEATEVFDRVLLGGSSDGALLAESSFYRGVIEFEKGSWAAARSYFIDTLRYFPRHPATLYQLGKLDLKEGHWKQAIGWFDEILHSDSDNPYALLERARCSLLEGRKPEAIVYLLQMHQANPGFKGGLGLLAQLLEEDGRTAEAFRVRSKITSGAVVAYPDEWLDRLRRWTYDIKKLGIFYEDYKNAKQLEEALWYLNRIEELDPRDWNAKLLKGILFAEEGNLNGALQLYEKSIEFGANKETVSPLIVKCLFLLKRINEAEAFGLDALSRFPNSVDLLVELAGVKIVQYDFDGAADYFKRALSLDPYNEKALRYFSAMLVKRGNLRLGIQYLEMLVKVQQTNPLPKLELSSLRLREGKRSEAVELVVDAKFYLKNGSEASSRLIELAEEFRSKSYRNDALFCLEALLELEPRNFAALSSQAEILVQLKRFEEASRSLSELVALQPDNLEVRIAHGDVLSMAGQRNLAEEAWRSSLLRAEKANDNAIIKEVRRRLVDPK